MSQQLVKKGINGRYDNVMPKSWIEAIKDKYTGQSLLEILQGFNMYFLSYTGNKENTRLQVPMNLRKRGLWIVYENYDNEVIVEWYDKKSIEDEIWKLDSSWKRVPLTSDIKFKIENGSLYVSYNNGKSWEELGVLSDISITSNIVPDEEDITAIESENINILKLKNRDNTKGKGYIILRTDKPIAEQIEQENTIYEVRYDFDLGGKTLDVPANCALDFVGGRFFNGKMIFNETKILGLYDFSNVSIEGCFEVYSRQTAEDIGLGNVDNTPDNQKSVKFAQTSNKSNLSLMAEKDTNNNNITRFYAPRVDVEANSRSIERLDVSLTSAELDLSGLKDKYISNKGYFSSSSELTSSLPNGKAGDKAYVGNTYPYQIWKWNGSSWVNTGYTGGEEVIPLNNYYTKDELDTFNYTNLDISSLTDERCSLGHSQRWYYDETMGIGKHKVIPINPTEYLKIKLSADNITYIGFLNSYNPPYNDYDVVPYCASNPDRIQLAANEEYLYNIPSDCTHIVLTTVDGGGTRIEFNVQFLNRISLIDNVSDINYHLANLKYKEKIWKIVNIENLTQEKCSLHAFDLAWYHEDGKGYHKGFKVAPGDRIIVRNPNVETYIGFLKGYKPPYNSDDKVPYCKSRKGRLEVFANTTVQYYIPNDCDYFVFVTVNGAGEEVLYESIEHYTGVEGKLQNFVDETNESIQSINNALETGGSIKRFINASVLDEQMCSLGQLGTWYYDSVNGHGKHKAIQVQGEGFVKIQTFENVTYIGFLTAAYAPPYTNGQDVPYCQSNPSRIIQDKNSIIEYKIPSDCSYIIITSVDGEGNIVNYGTIELYSKVGISDAIDDLRSQLNSISNGGSTAPSDNKYISRLRVMSWNIGHFCNGTGVATTITNENYLEKRTAFRNLFNEQGADIIGLVEYSDVFNGTTGESAETAIISQYNNKRFGKIGVGGYVCNGIVTNINIPYTNTINFPIEYYAIETEINYMGSKFMFCSAHLPWQSEEYNKQAINILIDRYKNVDKVVIVGDFNIRADNDYDLFANAGYVMANHGYLGDIITYPNESPSQILDNIIVKGGQILHTKVLESDLSDHYPVVADIVI